MFEFIRKWREKRKEKKRLAQQRNLQGNQPSTSDPMPDIAILEMMSNSTPPKPDHSGDGGKLGGAGASGTWDEKPKTLLDMPPTSESSSIYSSSSYSTGISGTRDSSITDSIIDTVVEVVSSVAD